jgi:biotin operon repressor
MAVLASPLHSDFVSVGKAAELLGISRNSVKRRIAAGLLRGYTDPSNGYQYVSRASVDDIVRLLRRLQASAQLPGSQPIDESLAVSPGDED